jgi:hypothetical protein
MKQEVVITTCDRCGREARMPLVPQKHSSDQFVIPEEWLHVAANTKDTLVFASDLCPECKKPVLEAVGAAA